MSDARDPNPNRGGSLAQPWLPEAALGATILIWSSTFLVTKSAFTHISVLAFIAVRFGLTTLMAFGILWVVKRRNPALSWTPRRSDWGRIVLAGLTGFTINGLGFNFGVDRTSVFSAAFLNSTAPLFTFLILALIGERSPPLAWLGIVIATAGVVCFLLDSTGGSRSLSGDLLCLMSAAAFAVYGIMSRPLTTAYPAPLTTAWTLLAGSIPLVLVGLSAALDQSWSTLPTKSWLALGYMVVFPVYVAYILFHYSISKRGAALTSSFILVVPVLSGLLATTIYDEPFGANKLFGAGLILTGLVTLRYSNAREDLARRHA
jgi:drug/metabolite transporter (DMT)-like permease